jgi:hypothetical protein
LLAPFAGNEEGLAADLRRGIHHPGAPPVAPQSTARRFVGNGDAAVR